MHLTVATFQDQIVNIEVDGSTDVPTLKAILEAETGVPAAQQALIVGTRLLKDNEALGAAGVNDGDVIQMMPMQAQGGGGGRAGGRAAPAAPPAAGAPDFSQNPDGSLRFPEHFINTMKADLPSLAGFRINDPQLAKCIEDSDINGLQNLLRERTKARNEALRREQELLEADPLDVDAQTRIEELIHQKNIQENYEHALEHNPEVFTHTEMLYVDMEVNGVPVKAFCDTGAQMSIMTAEMAEKCFLTRLIDKRFQGMAVGVGSSKILGRVHQAPLKVGGHFLTSPISVLEQKSGPQFIFGLDNMRRHACIIDLVRGKLKFGSIDKEVEFIPESQVKDKFVTEVSEEEAARSMATAERGGNEHGVTPTATGTGAAAAGTSAAAPEPPTTGPAPTAAPASAGSAPAPAHPPAAAAAHPMEAAIAALTGLGYPREQALAALQQTGGNVEAAAAMLTFGQDAMFD